MSNAKIIITGLILLFGIFGCEVTSKGKIGKDGYYFEQESFTRTNLQIQIVLYDTPLQLKTEFARRRNNISENRELVAFSTLNTNGTEVCTIHMVDPKRSYAPEFIGHEMTHCIYGEWHKTQP